MNNPQSRENLPRIIAVVGTTASGKSDLGVEIARAIGGEVVSADSRQVFRGLNLGTGKITPEEMKGIPHHLLDVVDPGEFFSMADYQKLAYQAIDGILHRRKVPVLVGGTGLYATAVMDGYLLSDKIPDLQYREYLETKSTTELFRMLMALRPEAEVDANNRNRVMRMLERLHDGDELSGRKERRYDTLRLGIRFPRDILCERIRIRLNRRLEEGMIEEVQQLLDHGVPAPFLDGLGLEYRYITGYLTGQIATREEMTNLLFQEIRRFSKRQMTWFKRDPEIIWIDMDGDPVSDCIGKARAFLQAGELAGSRDHAGT